MFVLFAPTSTSCTLQEAQDFAYGLDCAEVGLKRLSAVDMVDKTHLLLHVFFKNVLAVRSAVSITIRLTTGP
jgi:hypothetical protein